MPRTLLLTLLLAAPAVAADDPFDPFDRAFGDGANRLRAKQAAFERLLARKGAPSMVRALKKIEGAVAKLDRARAKEHARFVKAHKAYFGWRASHDDDAEAVPGGLNSKYLGAERAMRRINSIHFRELEFHYWVEKRLLTLARSADDKFIAALRAGLRAKSPHQRLRCAGMLAAVPQDRAAEAVAAGLAAARHPAVVAALAATGLVDVPDSVLFHAAWTARAGAIDGLGARLDRASAARLVARIDVEKGRLRDDLEQALALIANEQRPDWNAWLAGLPADWKPGVRPSPPPFNPEVASPRMSATDRTCFGLPTGSERIVICVDGAAARGQVRKEVGRFLESLPERAQFALVAFSDGASAFRKKPVAATGANRAAALRWLEKRKPGERADLYDGLQLAFDIADAGSGKPARMDTIVLFAPRRTTAVGDSPTLVAGPRQIALELGRRNRLLRIRLHAMARSSGGQAYFLQTLARPYGGGLRQTGP